MGNEVKLYRFRVKGWFLSRIFVTRLAKRVLYRHSFRSHFSLLFDRYNNRPTVHACIIAKSSTVYFYWGLNHGPVWRPQMLGCSVNGSNFPGKADRRQGITTGLAGETGYRFSYILRRVELKTAWIEPFGHIKVFVSELPATSWLPTTPSSSTPIGILVVLTTLWNKL